MENDQFPSRRKIDVIVGARIIFDDWNPSEQYDIVLDASKIKEIIPHKPDTTTHPLDTALDARNHLIAPSLCHAHVHLDKCFLFSDPKFADLETIKGDFAEAMDLTSKAKERFEREDLLRRGKWLVSESIAAGVTHMRAFVEVDHGVRFKCLDAAVELKEYFSGFCEIQICAFAQEPIFSGPHWGVNQILMNEAAARAEVEVVGSTPYVEDHYDSVYDNYFWSIKTGSDRDIHVDLHMDYHLDKSRRPVTEDVIGQAWRRKVSDKTLIVAHCTRLTQLSRQVWEEISNSVRASKSPLSFVGLPTSDLFMMGKPSEHEGGGERVRGTLQIPQMIKDYGLNGAISINNVGNAFTPQGSCDPLSIASMGVGLYHAGTKADAQLLYECVSTRAKEVIGYPTGPSISTGPFAVGADADFVLFEMGDEHGPLSRQRGRRTLQEVVYDPPKERKTIFRGHLISV
ncbi:cytosine/creatinine deaminase, partial [Lecanoromycetidae sp. Uapishka_2]